MGVDSDPFDDDIFAGVAANNNARAGGRFQPRGGKRGPVRKQPSALSCSSSHIRLENESNIAVQNQDSSKPYKDECTKSLNQLELVTNQESVNHTVESHAESNVLVTGQSSGLEQSIGENAAIACPHSTTGMHDPKLLPGEEDLNSQNNPTRASMTAAANNSGGRSGSTTMTVALEEQKNKRARRVSSAKNTTVPLFNRDDEYETNSDGSVKESNQLEDNGVGKLNENEEQLEEDPLTSCLESPLDEDPLTGGHPIVSVSEGSLLHDGRLERKQVELDPCLESLDISDVTSYGPRTGKFQPKPKIHVHEARSKVSSPNPGVVQSSGMWENEYLDLPEVQNTISECHEDDVLDLSSLGFDHSAPLELTSQLPAHEMSPAEPAPHEGDTSAVCDMHERMGTPGEKDNQRTASTSNQRLRPRRKCNNDRQSVDESKDEEPNELSADPSEHLIDHNADKELQVDNKTQEKKLRKGSKKPVVEKEKPVRKRKKAGEATNQATGTSKKFPHSTRQRKRRVDQVLLETPEDEIEHQKVPLRDLIILADYKERMTKKTATTSQVPSTDKSTGSIHDNEYESPSEQVEVTEEALFNYQSLMKKTPITRWSKQDTELFYQAIQQFGTDLSMIQQLFPGRTRRQVKLKYKKEERQQPLRLREALTNRPNDFSHFQHVIEHLQKAAAESQETGSKDESFDFIDDEEAEQMPDTIDDEAKSEPQREQEVAGDLEAEVQVKSPSISYDSEEDWEFDFSQYKSEV